MSVLMVPELGVEEWPTLGPQVCDFIETFLVFGPGDLRGQPAVLDAEKRALVHRLYEVWPEGTKVAGRRRFKRGALSMRKGTAKTEFAAWLAAVELHPEGPVRCDGFTHGKPIGRGVQDPYIPLVAYTEEQSDELAYAALKTILEESDLARDFDIGLDRIARRVGHGRAVSLAAAPSARDGARTTFQVFDETHRLILPNQKKAHQTMLNNIPKRFLADAWTLEITTAYSPGENSVAEDTMRYAREVTDGKVKDSQLFFFHRQAGEGHDLSTTEGCLAAVADASGPAASWSDLDNIVALRFDPSIDLQYWTRVWLNQPNASVTKAFSRDRWDSLAKPEYTVEDDALIVLGFDGSVSHDHTALVGTEVETGHQWLVGYWEPTRGADGEMKIDVADVDATVAAAFERWQVWRMYCDPFYWQTSVAAWQGRHGEDKVKEWMTNRYRAMAYALLNYRTAIESGELSHDGSKALSDAIGNAQKRPQRFLDDNSNPMWIIEKERSDSPFKIDAAMAGALSWEARSDAVAAGAAKEEYVTAFWLGIND